MCSVDGVLWCFIFDIDSFTAWELMAYISFSSYTWEMPQLNLSEYVCVEISVFCVLRYAAYVRNRHRIPFHESRIPALEQIHDKKVRKHALFILLE